MSIPNVPAPDELVVHLLQVYFGLSAAIVGIIVLLTHLWSWFGITKESYYKSKKLVGVSRRASNHLLHMRPIAIGAALFTCIIMLAVQASWLWISYVVGNGWSYLFDSKTKFSEETGPDWNAMFNSLHWDRVSQGYVAICLVALLACYAFRNEGANNGIAVVVALPSILAGIITGAISVFVLLFATLRLAVDHEFVVGSWAKSILVFAGLTLAHLICCLTVLGTPRLMFKVWSPVSARGWANLRG